MLTEEQFLYLAKKYMDTVFRLAFHYTKSRSESDDITQEVLLKLYRADKAFESEDHVRHWLIRVTVNECKRAFLSPWKRTEPIEDYAEQLAHGGGACGGYRAPVLHGGSRSGAGTGSAFGRVL